jgi:histone H3/H4
MAAKKKSAAKKEAKKTREIVVVGSKVKDVVRSAGYRSDGELIQAISDKVHELLEAAIKRAESNKRGTVRPYDL